MSTKLFDEVEEKPVEFTIKANAHAISVLSKSLYSRPYEAVVRELVANAVDSHKASGVNKLVDIDIDGDFDRRLKVRDYGEGLAPSDLEVLYTTYFGTTKTAGDKFTGSFGLGAKSPFAIASSFTVKSYWYGVCYEYKAFICEETGMPKIQKVSAETSPIEESGLEVIVPCGYTDYSSMRDALYKVLPFFYGHINTHGVEINNPLVKAESLGPCKVILPRISYETETAVTVVMGHVAYPVSNTRIPFKLPPSKYYFEVPTGTIDVTPSREDIHYTTKSINVLKELLKSTEEAIETERASLLCGLSKKEIRSKYQELRALHLGELLFPKEGGFFHNGEKIEIRDRVETSNIKRYSVEYGRTSNCGIIYTIYRGHATRGLFVRKDVGVSALTKIKEQLKQRGITDVFCPIDNVAEFDRNIEDIKEIFPDVHIRVVDKLNDLLGETPKVRKPRSKFTWNILNKSYAWKQIPEAEVSPNKGVLVLIDDKYSCIATLGGKEYVVNNRDLAHLIWNDFTLYGVSKDSGFDHPLAKDMHDIFSICDKLESDLTSIIQEYSGNIISDKSILNLLNTVDVVDRIPYLANLIEGDSSSLDIEYNKLKSLVTWREVPRLSVNNIDLLPRLKQDFPLINVLKRLYIYEGSDDFKDVKKYFDDILTSKGW